MRNIIFTQRVEVVESYNERRDCADQRIADFIFKCGFMPIPVPNSTEIVDGILQNIRVDGIVLTGGNSLTVYGGNASERDATDHKLIEEAIKRKIPIYGFCRGMQSILHYFGNELIQVEGHVAIRHSVEGVLGKTEVNSYHNQACIKLVEECGLEVLAQAGDGVIEAIRHKEYPIIGTMWHPERETEYSVQDIERMKELFG